MVSSRNRTKSRPAEGKRPQPAGEQLRLCLLAAFAAVCVGRPLVPSEGVSWIGDGHPFTLLLLIIAAGYLVVAVLRGGFSRRFHLIDAAVAALVLLCIASNVVGLLGRSFKFTGNLEFGQRAAAPRVAINMIWEWAGLGLVYFLARQLIVAKRESRGVVSVMIALAVVLSGLGLYQVFVTLPAEQAAYAADPDRVLRELGQWFPPGSPERARFEDRLNSTEPLATFALANSLAGYLAPWLIVALGVTWNLAQGLVGGGKTGGGETGSGIRRRPALMRVVGMAACLALVLVCLVLTKSRSAYVALAVGVVLLPLSDQAFRRLLNWRVVTVGALVLAVGIGAALASGRLDAQVLTEAKKSLGYRLEYWQATLDVIAAYPILGVGPGEFQNYYTLFKRPEASEEIRDPHNFLLEAWATAGTPAFLALVAVLALFAWQSWELAVRGGSSAENSAVAARPASAALHFVTVGAASGMAFAYFVGQPFGFYLPLEQVAGGLLLGAGVVALLWTWAAAGSLPPRLPALGVLVLAVHWLAAGGFTFPGVAYTFWLLVALGVNQQDDVQSAAAVGQRGRLVPLVGLAVVIGGALAFYYTAFLPVLAGRAAMVEALDESLPDENRYQALLAATEADPAAAEPWAAIAQLSVDHLKQDPNSERWGARFVQAVRGTLQTRGRSSAAYRQVAGWYRETYEADANPDLARQVLRYMRTAAALYPNSAAIQAEFALAAAATGDSDLAERAARKALELDRLTPHADKKLSSDAKAGVESLLSDPDEP